MMSIKMKAIGALSKGLSKTQKLSMATQLLKSLTNTYAITLTMRDKTTFCNKSLGQGVKTFDIQLREFLEFFQLLDSDSQKTIIHQLNPTHNG